MGIDQRYPAFEALQIRKSFGRNVVLDDFNLRVDRGATVGLLGANGTGKSTFLKILIGLIAPDSGRSSVGGEPSQGLTPQLRGRLGYVPQQPGQFPWLTGKAMLSYVGSFYPNSDTDYARELLERWKVSLKTPIAAMSPGQQQRLSLVRALTPRPDFLVLDEPIASLDPATRVAVIEELIAERERRELSVLFSSHITGDLRRLCSHFAVLAAGKVVLLDRTEYLSGLVRLRLKGAEALLTALTLDGGVHSRRPADGARVLVGEAGALEALRARLPSSIESELDAPDLELMMSEWMQ